MAKSKAQIMREGRERKRALGLERVEVYVPSACRERLTRYVETYLSGQVPPKRDE